MPQFVARETLTYGREPRMGIKRLHGQSPCKLFEASTSDASAVDPPGAEAALGAGDDAVQLVEQVAGLRDRVGPLGDIPAQRAIDGGVVAQRVQRLHTRAVDAVEIPATMAIPVRHRRAD